MTRGWIIGAVCVLAGCLGLTLLSWSFVYGQGHARRPILGFLLLYGLCWLGMVIGIAQIRSGRVASVHWVVTVAVLARVLLLPSSLILENDVYRYVLEGQNLLHAQNPYLLSPTQVSNHPAHPLRPHLSQPVAAQVLERTGYPEVPTVYPPMAQFAFAAGVLLTGWDWQGQRYIFLLVDLAVIGTLLVLLKRLQIFPSWVILYAWNPLVLKEVVNSAHVDVLVCLFLLLVVLSAVGVPSWRLACVASGCFLGLATLSKIYPILLGPVLCVWLYRRFQLLRAPLVATTALLVTVVVGYWPFSGKGLTPLFQGLRTYAAYWTMNEGVFGLVNLATDWSRQLTCLGIGAFALLCAWNLKAAKPLHLVTAMQATLLVWLLLTPAVFPWYGLPLTALACLHPGSFLSRTTILLSLLIGLYYMSFYVEYHDSPPQVWILIRIFEHALIWMTLLVTFRRRAGQGEACRTQG